jgi:hypothetical protein
MVDSKVAYRFMGEGDLPICDMMNALRSINYDGYISLEWVKRWMPELSDAGVVFPHFYELYAGLSGQQASQAPGCIRTKPAQDRYLGKRTRSST